MRQFGLIGYPLSHSFSKRYFSEKFQKECISDCAYENYPLSSVDLFPELLKTTTGLEGLNVTIPYKESVLPFLDQLEPAAAAIGAVNCIRFRHGKATGYNTDVIGFERSLKPLLKPHHTRALILGTGGASKAVAFALNTLGIEFKFVSRKEDERYFSYEDLDGKIMQQYHLIINTTPLGTSPDIHASPPIPYHLLGQRHLLYDLVYNPPETLFLQQGGKQGAAGKNGFEMLVLQAEASWDIWNASVSSATGASTGSATDASTGPAK